MGAFDRGEQTLPPARRDRRIVGVYRRRRGRPFVEEARGARAVASCPGCGAPNNHHDPFDGSERVPESGDASVCEHCGTISVFHTGPFGVLFLRAPDPAEAARFAKSPAIQWASADVRSGKRRRRRTTPTTSATSRT
jgi:hypothetical protein